jgi:hypothetical protein
MPAFPKNAQFTGWFSDPIDLTATGTYVVIPAMSSRLRIVQSLWEIKTKGGTVSVNPTYQAGTDSPNYSNYYASQTTAGFTTQAVETIVAPTAVVPNLIVDLTASGLKVKVTAGATGTNPVLTARFITYGFLVPV